MDLASEHYQADAEFGSYSSFFYLHNGFVQPVPYIKATYWPGLTGIRVEAHISVGSKITCEPDLKPSCITLFSLYLAVPGLTGLPWGEPSCPFSLIVFQNSTEKWSRKWSGWWSLQCTPQKGRWWCNTVPNTGKARVKERVWQPLELMSPFQYSFCSGDGGREGGTTRNLCCT